MNRFVSEIWAVAFRDLKKKEHFAKYILLIISMAAMLFLIGFGFDTFIDFSQYGSSYSEFFTSGILIFYIAMLGLYVGVELVVDKKGFLKLMLVTPVSRYAILFGKIIAGFLTSIKTFFIVILLFLFLFKTITAARVLEIILFIFFITLIFHGFGLWLSSLFSNRDTASSFVGYLSFAMLFLSGIFYPLEALPPLLRLICFLNPLTYTVDLFRFIIGGHHYFSAILNILILGMFGTVSIFLGTYQFDKNLRK